MEDLDFITTLAYFLNVGVFSAVISRFSGAPISILVCCAVLYVGATPLETIGIMLTYLVFMRLTIYTQKNRVNFKKMEVFSIPLQVSLFSFSYSWLKYWQRCG